ncbi:MAG: LPS assembly lipoprotein LptE [Rickettsiales bacterium]|jgi:LPS-assembly lipoprotein|nr:LPS assembly lipoprotein LptE [Rickettsiales bacterium]
MSWLARVWNVECGVWRRWLFLTLCTLHSTLLLTGCGFQPMYGARQEAGKSAIAGVSVEATAQDRRTKQQLQISLEDKLNPTGAIPANPTYRLVADVSSSVSGIGVSRDGTATRYNVNLTSSYQLYKTGEEKPVTTGTLRHVSSYNNLPNQYYSTYVSEQDAIRRGIGELAEMYRQRLSPYLATKDR